MSSRWQRSVGAAISTVLTLKDIAQATSSFDPSSSELDTPLLQLLSETKAKGYDSITLPLTTEKWKKRWEEMCLLPPGSDKEDEIRAEQAAEKWRSRPGFLSDEVTVTRLDEAEGVTVIISDWLELDSVDDWVRHDAEIALQQELAYASYLNIQSAILPTPRNRDHVASYARIVNSCLKNTPYMHLSIRLPIYNPSVLHSNSNAPSSPPLGFLSSAESLGSLSSSPSGPRLLVPGSQKLTTAPESELNATWEMWDLIRSMCNYNTRLTLTLDLSPPLPTTLGVLSKWAAESVRNILLPSSTFIANSKGYPVLPKTTQSFIRDCMIVKHYPNVILAGANEGIHGRGGETAYKQYVGHLEKTSPAVEAAEKVGTVENFAQGYQDYLQAPLQPLMDNLQSVTYQTFEQDPVKYRLYEEAMYAALMDWRGPDKVVFCIAGAGRGPLVARCLKAIERSGRDAFVYAVEKNPNAYVTLQDRPSSYTAHLAPLSSSKLFNEARATKDAKSLETPYVVMFQAVNILSGNGGGLSGKCGPKIQECWEFVHPRIDPVLDDRGALKFSEPLYLPSNSELQVSIWRLTNERQVWYEWHAESFLSSPTVQFEGAAVASFPASSSGSLSPFIDADDPTNGQRGRSQAIDGAANPLYETVKIGQTSLHNPGAPTSSCAVSTLFLTFDKYEVADHDSEPTSLTWSDGQAPFYISVIPARAVAHPKRQQLYLERQSSSWHRRVLSPPLSTFYQPYLRRSFYSTISIKDSTGQQAYSDIVTINSSKDTSCLNASSSDTAASTPAASESGNSNTGSATSSAGTTGAPSTAASTTTGKAVSSNSAPNSSNGDSSKTNSAASGSTTKSASSNGAATTTNAAHKNNVGGFALAGVMALVGLVVA
ncbi:hypothetical protein H0H93_010530 [Arthromyces matolae]|nr:hypothetical protein H0H93_010530 [Arthromyces matolae]